MPPEQNKNTLSATISANQLANPVQEVTVPEPVIETPPDLSGATAVADESKNIIAAKTAEAEELAKLRREFGALGEQGSLQDVFSQTTEQFGVDVGADLGELKDIQLQLAGLQEASGLTKERIKGAGGQTLAQAQREVTQEDREAAVRQQGLAARAAVLTGNINTAVSLARQAVDTAFRERQLKNSNLLNQINSLQGVVDEQTDQLLAKEVRRIEKEDDEIKETKDAIANAIVSGASQEEILQLQDANSDDATKKALAEQIVGRQSRQQIELEQRKSRAQALSAELSAAKTQREIDRIDNAVNQVQSGGIYGIMEASSGGRSTDATFNQSLSKAFTLSNQLTSLSQTFQDDAALRGVADGVDLAPIEAIWRSRNPYDEKARAIQAQLTAIVPNLARGIYGEVGVLTDTDFEKYSQTLPNLSSPQELRDAMMMITLDSVKNSVADQIEISASTGRDVSGLIPRYERFEKEIGTASAPILMKSKTVGDLTAAGANPNEIKQLLSEGYSLTEIESAYLQ